MPGDRSLVLAGDTGQGAGHGRTRRRRPLDDRRGLRRVPPGGPVQHLLEPASAERSRMPIGRQQLHRLGAEEALSASRLPGLARNDRLGAVEGHAVVLPAGEQTKPHRRHRSDAVARRVQIKRTDWPELRPALVGSLADIRLGGRRHHRARPAGHRSDHLPAGLAVGRRRQDPDRLARHRPQGSPARLRPQIDAHAPPAIRRMLLPPKEPHRRSPRVPHARPHPAGRGPGPSASSRPSPRLVSRPEPTH